MRIRSAAPNVATWQSPSQPKRGQAVTSSRSFRKTPYTATAIFTPTPCRRHTLAPAVETGISQSDNVALARRVFGWFTQHDRDAFLSALHPEVYAHPSLHRGPELHGREEVAR